MKIELTKAEKTAIAELKRVAKVWPKSLWLWSANGSLCIMKCDKNNNPIYNKYGAVDSDHIVDKINIYNDGGDW